MMPAFRVLAALKGLRGTPFDLFGHTAERRLERRLLADYEADIALIEGRLGADRIEAAAALASVPSLIRGFGHVKAASVERAAAERARLLDRFTGKGEKMQLESAA
jgi:indolepyruvate ferredoxin oxidoreductase